MMRSTILLGIALLVVGNGCSELGPDPQPPFDEDAPTQTIERTRIIWSADGRKNAVIQAMRLTRFERSDEVRLQDSVQVDVYDEAGTLAAVVTGDEGILNDRTRTARVESGITVRFLGSEEYGASTLTADRAEADEGRREVVASGAVRIVSERGVTLTTEHLVWDGRRRQFHAPGFVRITNGTETEEGESFTGNADLTQWTMERVTGRSTRPLEKIEATARRETE